MPMRADNKLVFRIDGKLRPLIPQSPVALIGKLGGMILKGIGALVIGSALIASCNQAPKTERESMVDSGLKPRSSSAKIATSLPDGPFGIAKGTSLDQLENPTNTSPGLFKLKSAPRPYPNIEFYVVKNTPSQGTCFIRAVSNDIASDSFGNAIRSAMDSVKGDLSERYGKPTESFDFLQSGSIWNEPEDWLTGLSKEERTYAYFWRRPKNGADPKIWRETETIGLVASAGSQAGWFSIQYDFDNVELCDAELKKDAAKAL